MFEDEHLEPEEFARRVNDQLLHLKDHISIKYAKWFLEHGWTPSMVLNELHDDSLVDEDDKNFSEGGDLKLEFFE